MNRLNSGQWTDTARVGISVLKVRAEEIIEITAPRNKRKFERKSKRNESLKEKVQFMKLDFWKESIWKSYSSKLWLRIL